MTRIKVLFLLLAVSLLKATTAQGQTATLSVSAPQFMPVSSATTYFYSLTGLHLYSTVTNGTFLAEIHPPNGAILNAFEFDACNSNTSTADLILSMFDTDAFGNNPTLVAGPTTVGPSPTMPCQAALGTIAGYVVDNTNRHLIISVTTQAGDSTTSFSGVKVMWNPMVFSYASTPYFTDVLPTDPTFPYVQRMYELGISKGCGGNMFCPTANVTREQNAVYAIKGFYASSW